MNDTIEFGIGFVTGRPNVCKIINSYYKNMIEQLEKSEKKVNLTIFMLYESTFICSILKENKSDSARHCA